MRLLLLDTHVALWLLLGDREAVSSEATAALSEDQNTISISAVSYWEIAIKRSLGRLSIGEGWVKELSRLDFEPMPINTEHARGVEHLPWHHRDPFDRLLVAQAQVERHSLVSADRGLEPYGVEIVW